MNPRLTNLLAAIALVGILGAGALPRARASFIPVPITNSSFETPDASPPPGYTRTDPTGWTETITGDGGVAYYPGHVPDGNQAGWEFNSTFWQKTSAVFTAGDGYQLNAAVAADSFSLTTNPVDITYALYSGSSFATGTLLAQGTATPSEPNQTFEDVTLTFDPSSPGYAALLAVHAGENIIVAFTASSGVGVAGDEDNVQLVITPEPASLGLLACGSLLMLRRRRA